MRKKQLVVAFASTIMLSSSTESGEKGYEKKTLLHFLRNFPSCLAAAGARSIHRRCPASGTEPSEGWPCAERRRCARSVAYRSSGVVRGTPNSRRLSGRHQHGGGDWRHVRRRDEYEEYEDVHQQHRLGTNFRNRHPLSGSFVS